MKRKLAGIILSTLGALLALPSYAATLQVYPVNVGFCAGETAQAIYVKNVGSAAIGAQIRVYAWHQQNNKDSLSDTEDLLVSPPMTSIPAARQQLIRVILPVPPSGDTERAYRLVVDELPGSNNMAEKDGVRFLLRYSIPVFVNCKDQQPDLNRVTFSIDHLAHPVMLKVRNNGTQHLKLSDITLHAGAQSVSMSKGLLGYVLPQSEKEWPLPKGMTNASSLSLNLNDNEKQQTINITP
ncbi:TPA: molecular chaperone [Kluyvera ascorbata]|nr:molecular chaperone [Kluyvera ascorbata]